MKLDQVTLVSIVDDDESVREAMKSLVCSFVLRNFCNQLRLKTRLSITDVQMLSLSRVELQNRMLSDGYHMPTIFIPVFPNSQIEEWVVQSGAIAFLRKPFNEDELFEHLETAIKRSHP